MEIKHKITENNTEELQSLLDEAAQAIKKLEELTKKIGKFQLKVDVVSEVVE